MTKSAQGQWRTVNWIKKGIREGGLKRKSLEEELQFPILEKLALWKIPNLG